MKARHGLYVFLIVLLVSQFAVFQFVPNVRANSDWLTGWGYRKSHVINYASGAGTNYQIKIIAHYGSGTDSGADVYLNSHCRTDFGDVRFTDDDGTTLLDYWMESKVDSDNAVFWVEVADDLSSANQTIYIYYGKADATTTSNGNATFQFFDDFSGNLSKWTVVGGTWQIENGELVASTNARGQRLRANNFVFGNHAVHAKIKWISGTYFEHALLLRGQTDERANSYFVVLSTYAAENRHKIIKIQDGSHSMLTCQGTTNPSQNVWYNGVFKLYGSSIKSTFAPLYSTEISTTDTAFSNGSLCLFAWSEQAEVAHYDDVFVRKYVDPEPAHGSWGSEETAAQSYTFYGSIPLTFTLGSIKGFSFMRQGTIPLTFTFLSTITQAITKNFYGSIPLTFSIETLKAMTFNLFGSIPLTFTFEGTATFTHGILLKLYGTIPLTFTLETLKAINLNIFSSIPIQFAINGIAQYITKHLLFYGTIPLQFILRHTISGLPEIAIDWGMAAMGMAIVAFAIAIVAFTTRKT